MLWQQYIRRPSWASIRGQRSFLCGAFCASIIHTCLYEGICFVIAYTWLLKCVNDVGLVHGGEILWGILGLQKDVSWQKQDGVRELRRFIFFLYLVKAKSPIWIDKLSHSHKHTLQYMFFSCTDYFNGGAWMWSLLTNLVVSLHIEIFYLGYIVFCNTVYVDVVLLVFF